MYRVNFRYGGAFCHADFEVEQDAKYFVNQRGLFDSKVYKYELKKVYAVINNDFEYELDGSGNQTSFPVFQIDAIFVSKDKAREYVNNNVNMSIEEHEVDE